MCDIGCATDGGIVPATCKSCAVADCTCSTKDLKYGKGYAIKIQYNTNGGIWDPSQSGGHSVWVSGINPAYTFNSGNFFTFSPFNQNNVPNSTFIEFVPMNSNKNGKPIGTGDSFYLRLHNSGSKYDVYQRNGDGCVFPQPNQTGGATTRTEARLMSSTSVYSSDTNAENPQEATAYKMEIYNTDVNADGGATWYKGNQIHSGTQPFWWINNQSECNAGGSIYTLMNWSFYPILSNAITPETGYCGAVNGHTFPDCPSHQTCMGNRCRDSGDGGGNTPPPPAPSGDWMEGHSKIIIYSLVGIITLMMLMK